MNREYVFDNKNYEKAVINIKAILLDIISSENELVQEKENKINEEVDDEIVAKLQAICNKERQSINTLLNSLRILVSSLQEIDSYSRDFDIVEDEKIAKIVADIRTNTVNNINLNSEQNNAILEQQENPQVENASQNNEEQKEQVPEETFIPINAELSRSIENTQIEETSPNNEEEKKEQVPEETFVPKSTEVSSSIENTQIEEASPNNEEEKKEQVPEETFVPKSTEVSPSIENTQIEETSPNNVEEKKEQVPEETFVPKSVESTLKQEQASTNTEEPVILIKPEEPNIDSEIPSGIKQSEEPQEEPTLPNIEEQINATPEIVAEEPKIPESIEEQKIPSPETVTKNFDEPQQDTTTATVEQSLSNIEEQQDETSEMTNSEASIQPEQELNFMKLNNNTPRAILTSAKQISNLRQSLATQEALVNSREEIGSININGVEDDVQNLVSNGLLSPSEENIEDMLNEASALYKEGKVEQAQALYEKISELNKKIKDTGNEENKEKELTKSNSNLIAA